MRRLDSKRHPYVQVLLWPSSGERDMIGEKAITPGDHLKRLQVHLNSKQVMTVHRRVLKKKKIVYLLSAASPIKYKGGRSRIVYVGTTKKGVGRIAGSAAARAEDILSTRGLKVVNVFVASRSSRAGLATWRCLEDALLAAFLASYHEPPMCNAQGKKKKWNEELDRLFKWKAINKVLASFDGTQ